MDNRTKTQTPLWVFILLGFSFLFMLCFRPTEMPPPWFDEGWTLSVARNWMETGKCARLLDGAPISATGMAWNFPVTGPIALSFRLFGVGILQGRVPSALFTIAATFLVYLLAKQMYGAKIAGAAILLIIMGFPFPLIIWRQAIGEPAMIFYLLAGFYAFLEFLKTRSASSILGSMLLWSAALTSKQQTLPFWILSMLTIVLVACFRRDRFTFWACVGIALGTLAMWQGMLMLQHHLEENLMLYGAPMQGLIAVTGWVPVWEIRIHALTATILYCFPLILGLGYAFFQEISNWRMEAANSPLFYMRLAYYSLTISWLVWFAVGAMNWQRYLYPVAFLGNVFVAIFLSKMTNNFESSQIVIRAYELLRRLRFTHKSMQAVLSIVILSYMGTLILITSTSILSNDDTEKIAQYLNQSTPSDVLVETYDSELLFLVQRRFSYPPDQVQVELNKRAFLSQDVDIQYDPMLMDPDYIVVGPSSNMWKLYDSVLAQQKSWELIYEVPNYRVYRQID